jgi:predicted oxidoreductase
MQPNLIAGVMRWGAWGANFNTKQYQNVIQHCLQNGINTFDHADIYGNYTTEKEFGDAITQMKIDRQSYKLISKCGIAMPCPQRPNILVKHYNYTYNYIIEQVNQSLINLNTSYLDVLLLHRPSPLMEPEVIANAINTLKNQGKVLHFGVSNFTTAQTIILQKNLPNLQYNQIELSFNNYSQLPADYLASLNHHNIKIMAYGVLGNYSQLSASQQAQLTQIAQAYNATIAQIALAWVYKFPYNVQPIIGSSQLSRISQAAAAFQINLSLPHWFKMLEISTGQPTA